MSRSYIKITTTDIDNTKTCSNFINIPVVEGRCDILMFGNEGLYISIGLEKDGHKNKESLSNEIDPTIRNYSKVTLNDSFANLIWVIETMLKG